MMKYFKISYHQIKLFKKIFAIILYGFSLHVFAFENLVYTWRGFPHEIAEGKIAIADLKLHASKIDLLSSQAYHIDDKGIVSGAVNFQMNQIAIAHHIKLMPLVGNTNFDRNLVHIFLSNKEAQNRAIKVLLQLCMQNHYEGLQVDFEGMSYLDRDAFTLFYQHLAKVLHENNFKISIAIVPAITENLTSAYQQGRYRGWTGVYDYKLLGAASDFVTLMAYDQHGAITIPGPMAAITWDEAIINLALKYIPAEKISLGIPWHSGYWHTGKENESGSFHAIADILNYQQVKELLRENNLTLRWDNIDKFNYAIFKKNYLYEYLFVEDAKSFQAKLNLVTQYHLRGISNWVLGEEDPNVWNSLIDKKH